MRRTKADRWERMADNMNGEHVSPERLAYELRREHRAVVRLVSSMKRFMPRDRAIFEHGFQAACDRIITRLNARAQ